MIEALESTLLAARRRARANGFLRRVAPWGGAALVGGGVAALLLRAFAGASAEDAALVFAAAPLAAAAAWIAAWRATPRPENAVAWLDLRAGGRGTLLAEYELGDARWRAAAEEALARVGPLPGFAARALATRGLPALAFALACLVVPIPDPPPTRSTAYFESLTAELREKLAALEEDVALDDATRAELEEQLESLEAEIASGLPEAVFEASDQLDSRLEELALGAREAAESAVEEARAAAERLEEGDEGAAGDLEAALDRLAESGFDESLAAELPEGLRELMENGLGAELDPELAKRAAELAKELSDRLDGKLGKLADAGLLDPSSLRKGELAKLSELTEHECDQECGGGT